MKKLKLKSKDALDIHKEKIKKYNFLKSKLDNIDLEEVWEHLEESLILGKKRKNIDHVADSLDSAEDNLRRAGMILQVAREELNQFKIHFRISYGKWALEARQELGKLKNKKIISGQITQDMVEDWVAINKEDYKEWKTHLMELERNKNLAKDMRISWESRTASLRRQSDIVEKRYGISIDMLEKRNKGE